MPHCGTKQCLISGYDVMCCDVHPPSSIAHIQSTIPTPSFDTLYLYPLYIQLCRESWFYVIVIDQAKFTETTVHRSTSHSNGRHYPDAEPTTVHRAHHISMGHIILTQNQQQSTGAHHIPMGHIILTQNQQLCILTCLSLLSKELSNDIVIVLFWFLLFKPTEDQTDNRPHSKQARRQSYNRHGMYLQKEKYMTSLKTPKTGVMRCHK